MLAIGVFQHHDKLKIAKLCEKNNLPSKALELFIHPDDIKRVVVNTHQLQPKFLVAYFGTLEPALALDCIEELLISNSAMTADGRLVAQIAAQYSGNLCNKAITELFKAQMAESLFLHLSTVVHTLDLEIHFGYIEAATSLPGLGGRAVSQTVKSGVSRNPQ